MIIGIITFAGKSRSVPMRKFRKSPSVSSCYRFVQFGNIFRNIEKIFCVTQSETCQERARPYMMKAVVNQLKYLGRKFR